MKRLHVRFTPSEGSMLRLLGLVEGRGYISRAVTVRDHAEHAVMMIDVEARDSTRRVDVLARQLARLIDVESVSFEDCETRPE